MEEKNIRENSGKNKILVIILIALGLCLIGFGVYSWFIKCNDKPVDNGQIIYFTDNIELKLDNTADDKHDLYLNDKKIDSIDYESAKVTTVDKYLVIVWEGAQAGTLPLGYIDENGEYYKIDASKGLYNINYSDGKICAYQTFYDGNEGRDVELSFNKGNITITEVDDVVDNDEDETDFITINSKDKKININNKELTVKIVNHILYINGKNAVDLEYYDTANIIAAPKYAVISVQGQIDFYKYAINENGELINIIGGTYDTPNVSIENVRVENGKIVGKKIDGGENDSDYYEAQIEFVYEKTQVTVKEITS